MEIFKYFIYYMSSSSVSKIQQYDVLNKYFSSLQADDFIKPEEKDNKNNILKMGTPHSYAVNHIFNNPIQPLNVMPNKEPLLTDNKLKQIIPKKKDVYEFIKTSKSFMLKEINFALVLIAAFAWHDTIKFYIARNIKFYKGYTHYYLFYAIIISFITIIVISISNKLLDQKDKANI